jgi:sec-independent protein translocase protein TatC
MLITPPDMVSQTLLAIPVWALYELGIVFSRMVYRSSEAERHERESEASESTD